MHVHPSGPCSNSFVCIADHAVGTTLHDFRLSSIVHATTIDRELLRHMVRPTVVTVVICACAVLASEMPRKRKRTSAQSTIAPQPLDRDTLRKLSECGTRTGLQQTLQHMAEAGWLTKNVAKTAATDTRRKLAEAVTDHATATTPYGPVMQSMDMPFRKLPKWSFVHPLALLYHLAAISTAFGAMMADSAVPGVPMRIIIYIDEICPGNPLRPEKARTLQAIYWALADWPQWLLQRTAAWPCFGTIRSSLVKVLPGQVSALMKRVLYVFFPERGDSFTSGVTILVNNTALIVHGVFAGFLADEKAHKELTNTKGASGTKVCINCSNVFAKNCRCALTDGAVKIGCTDPAKFTPMSNEMVYDAYDYIAAAQPKDRPRLEQYLGIKYDEHCLMHDRHIRTFYKPVDHMIRDWQHTIVGGGVANVECGRFLHALGLHGIAINTVAEWLEQFTLPKQYGPIDRNWLSKKRLGTKAASLQSFAGVMLSLVPILASFASEVIVPGHALCDNMRCIWRLHLIIGICKMGPSMAMPYVGRLRQLIIEHAELFMKCYPGCERPKFHHLFHIPDNMQFLGALLSCFVCERKHRFTKRAALFVFRHIDNTVAKEMLSRQCEAIRGDKGSLFSKQYLHKPVVLNFGGTHLQRSTMAVLPCGAVHASDVVWVEVRSENGVRSVIVGAVVAFWSDPESTNICVQVNAFTRIDVHGTRWCTTDSTGQVVSADTIVDTMTYARIDTNTVLVIAPASALVQ